MLAKEIETIFVGQDVGEGDVDVDGVLKAFERLKSIVTEADLPSLVAAIQSPKNNFWTRELFAKPICQLGGSDYLEPLLRRLNLALMKDMTMTDLTLTSSRLHMRNRRSVAPN